MAKIGIKTKNMSFAFAESTNVTLDYALHCHNHYEVYYFLDGDVDYLVEGQKYSPAPGSMLLLAPHVFHGVKINSSRPYRRYTIHFDQEILSLERRNFLLSPFSSLMQNPAGKVYFENVERYHIPTYFQDYDSLRHCDIDEKIRTQMVSISMEALLSRVVYMYEAEAATISDIHSDTISRIIWYLNQHLKEDVTLDQISEKFFISKHHLNKIFRKATGTTVFDYLIRKRISMAQHLLINGFSAQDAAIESGFDDYSAFYRSYVRVLGHAPSQDKGGGLILNHHLDSKMESVVLRDKETFLRSSSM